MSPTTHNNKKILLSPPPVEIEKAIQATMGWAWNGMREQAREQALHDLEQAIPGSVSINLAGFEPPVEPEYSRGAELREIENGIAKITSQAEAVLENRAITLTRAINEINATEAKSALLIFSFIFAKLFPTQLTRYSPIEERSKREENIVIDTKHIFMAEHYLFNIIRYNQNIDSAIEWQKERAGYEQLRNPWV